MKNSETLTLKEIVRADLWRGYRGYYTDEPDENLCVNDLIVNDGRVFIAKRISADSDVASAMAYMAIGTVTTAATLTDSSITGEIGRKALSVSSATTNNVWQGINTWGGSADSITSVAITEAAILNHAGSGQGTMFQRVTFSSVTLANSDLLKLTLETNVGSNTI